MLRLMVKLSEQTMRQARKRVVFMGGLLIFNYCYTGISFGFDLFVGFDLFRFGLKRLYWG
jgi:hypothetical protein